jgi:hypothetical protein
VHHSPKMSRSVRRLHTSLQRCAEDVPAAPARPGTKQRFQLESALAPAFQIRDLKPMDPKNWSDVPAAAHRVMQDERERLRLARMCEFQMPSLQRRSRTIA